MQKPEVLTPNTCESKANVRPVSSSQNSESPVSKVKSSSTTVSSASRTLVLDSGTSQDLSTEESFDLEGNIFLYRDSHFHRIANVVGTLIASLIPIGATVILYFVSDMPIRLAIVSVFTAIFSIALSCVTSATRVEIFAATAA